MFRYGDIIFCAWQRTSCVFPFFHLPLQPTELAIDRPKVPCKLTQPSQPNNTQPHRRTSQTSQIFPNRNNSAISELLRSCGIVLSLPIYIQSSPRATYIVYTQQILNEHPSNIAIVWRAIYHYNTFTETRSKCPKHPPVFL